MTRRHHTALSIAVLALSGLLAAPAAAAPGRACPGTYDFNGTPVKNGYFGQIRVRGVPCKNARRVTRTWIRQGRRVQLRTRRARGYLCRADTQATPVPAINIRCRRRNTTVTFTGTYSAAASLSRSARA